MNSQSPLTSTLGADIRALRKARGLTLNDIATKLDRSVGWLSQVERDLSEPTISDLRQISGCFEVPMSMLFGHPNAPAFEQGYVVRSGARRPIGASEEGLIEELLSPDLTDDFEMVHSTFQAHSKMQTLQRRGAMPSLLEPSNILAKEQQEDICQPSEETHPRSGSRCEAITRER